MNTHNQQRSILGTLIKYPELFPFVSEALPIAVMFSPDLRPVAEFIWEHGSEMRGYDAAMVRDAVGDSIVNELMHDYTPRDLLEAQAEGVKNGWLSGELLKIYEAAQSKLVEGESYDDVKAWVNTQVEMLDAYNVEQDKRGDVIRKAMERVEKAMKHPGGLSGVPSGIPCIDEYTGGWQPGNLIIIGARPGMGKTTLMCEFALSAAQAERPVGFFSMGDMTKQELTFKFQSMLTGIPYKRIQRGRINQREYGQLLEAAEVLAELPIHLFDTTDMPPKASVMRDKARRMKDQYGIELMISDYIQQMRPDDDRLHGNAALEEVSRICKQTAAMLELPHLCASQLSRAVEIRGGSKRPQMADLRTSGAIEQDANMIAFMYRPEYYQIMEDEEGRSLKGITEFIVAKDRAGGDLETLRLGWHQERIKDYEAMQDDPAPHASASPTIQARPNDIDEPVPF